MTNSCELCAPSPFPVLFADTRLSVVLVTDTPDYPAFCRVVWRGHVREMTDLSAADRAYLMDWVFRTEAALRTVLAPDKINLASLGNVVPHLHWHVIPRFADDAHFPAPVWAARARDGVAHGRPDLAAALWEALGTNPPAPQGLA
ncbi:HIT family protein [Laribacter hongkongensis]|uniref:Hydrolase n=1 Tax=Laribacter hongkongensis TaxID=168471 RepID=A0A248LNX8_9NEIS|nr:HIT domain-containing protein [Laribacter hongkongensis]ASJ26179.1 hydrolase [Laribacter hongkongensis]MCG9041149.1 HIT domain-containing protein [Laribacter hongkongensis]MCG9068951.1 HIT domain-containing protein [Laribacter hongkongensis]MCG9088346.1 HIT domain-containing protein [Laribacter hongkongensis]MCG9110574.1 HIT domain-containing protein [Laribacter hongkongensis]